MEQAEKVNRAFKNLGKSLYYAFVKPSLPSALSYHFGFIFHTEKIHHHNTFNQLIAFCKHYNQLTKKRPLCVVMTPENRRVQQEMQELGVDEFEFLIRLNLLKEVADIGYHGHFWKSADTSFNVEANQIKSSNFEERDSAEIEMSFAREVNWLRKNGFNVNAYSGGWWLMNQAIMNQLCQHNFMWDFSFSYQGWVSNTWSKELLKKNRIKFGQGFRLDTRPSVSCLQTLMGCPNSTYALDFVRILNSYTKNSLVNPWGMITTHDYNIESNEHFSSALSQIKLLIAQRKVYFFSVGELNNQKELDSLPIIFVN